MTREHTVEVRLKPGVGGRVTHCPGHHHDIALSPGETATTWGNGDPITKTDFEKMLEPTGFFEVVVPDAAPRKAAVAKEK